MPYFVMETLSDFPGVAGLFVCCVFSASLSTLSSGRTSLDFGQYQSDFWSMIFKGKLFNRLGHHAGFNALAAVTWDDFLSRTRLANLEEHHVILGLIASHVLFYGGP